MRLTLLGLSHKTAPVAIREKLAFPADSQTEALAVLTSCDAVSEAVIVSTCNRTELYAVTSAAAEGAEEVLDFICGYKGVDREAIAPYLYASHGEAAVRHLFRVVSSLDSMVVGEAQILGQVKEAYELSFENGASGRVFNRLFRQSFEVGKRVRTETAIGENAVSISYAAVELAKKVFDSLAGRTVLILGAGKMSELTARHLVSCGAARILVANRTQSRAEELAEHFGGVAVPYDALYEHIAKADIVISSTAATEFVITKDRLEPAMRMRRGAPLFLIDIAVPRDIDPAVNDLDDAYLYDIDALNHVVESNLEERAREAARAEVIIAEEIGTFQRWLESMEVVPTIAAMHAEAERVREAEFAKAMRKLGSLSEKDRATVEALTQSLVNKTLATPTERLRRAAAEKDGYSYVEAARYLYGLDESGQTASRHGLGRLRHLLGMPERSSAGHGHENGGRSDGQS